MNDVTFTPAEQQLILAAYHCATEGQPILVAGPFGEFASKLDVFQGVFKELRVMGVDFWDIIRIAQAIMEAIDTVGPIIKDIIQQLKDLRKVEIA